MDKTLVSEILAIMIGGGIGSLLRFAFSSGIQKFTKNQFFPWGVLSVNLLGCLLIGLLFGIIVERFQAGPVVRAGVFIGLLGGFTTFSSFSLDVVTLCHAGSYWAALGYIAFSVGAGIAATALGLSMTRLVL